MFVESPWSNTIFSCFYHHPRWIFAENPKGPGLPGTQKTSKNQGAHAAISSSCRWWWPKSALWNPITRKRSMTDSTAIAWAGSIDGMGGGRLWGHWWDFVEFLAISCGLNGNFYEFGGFLCGFNGDLVGHIQQTVSHMRFPWDFTHQ